MSSLEQFLDPKGWLTPDTARRIVAWRPDETIRDRIRQLAEKSNEGALTDDERDEYERLIDEGDIIALVQLRARSVLEQAS
jgi:hypothetical protein